MRLAPLLFTVALAAPALVPASLPSAARADSTVASVPEIRLVGEPESAPAKPDPARSKAVERFLSARQDASVERVLAARLRRGLTIRGEVTDEILAGPRGATLIAFDFDDADLPRAGARAGRFEITAHLLFAGSDGQVVESRDEELTFTSSAGGWVCAKIVPTNAITWTSEATMNRANEAGIGRDLEQLKAHWRGSDDRGKLVGFSVSDVERAPDGDVVVSCLRYSARPGRRGFESDDASVVFTRQDGSFRIKSN